MNMRLISVLSTRSTRRVAFSAIAAAVLQCVAGAAHASDAGVLYTADGLENLYKDVLPEFEKK